MDEGWNLLRRIGTNWQEMRTGFGGYPLTLTLSPWGRGDYVVRLAGMVHGNKSFGAGVGICALNGLLPLPLGEGRGEGKRARSP